MSVSPELFRCATLFQEDQPGGVSCISGCSGHWISSGTAGDVSADNLATLSTAAIGSPAFLFVEHGSSNERSRQRSAGRRFERRRLDRRRFVQAISLAAFHRAVLRTRFDPRMDNPRRWRATTNGTTTGTRPARRWFFHRTMNGRAYGVFMDGV